MADETAKRRNGETARKPIRHFRDLDVYQNALATGLCVYELTKRFPIEERYALTDQVRRSSRSVCANIAGAWRKRRYKAAFISKLSDAEGEASENDRRAREVADQECATLAMNCDELEKWRSRERATSPFRPFAVSPIRFD
jgi:four helix bundle protein